MIVIIKMTTAHRPTWNSAKGATSSNVVVQPKRHYSALDMPAHKDLKQRATGQGTIDEQEHFDFKQELLAKERERADGKLGLRFESQFSFGGGSIE